MAKHSQLALRYGIPQRRLGEWTKILHIDNIYGSAAISLPAKVKKSDTCIQDLEQKNNKNKNDIK